MFDLVVDVKSDGWFNLLTAAGDLPIGATIGFSSVAGRFGNSRADRLRGRERPALQDHERVPHQPPRHPGLSPWTGRPGAASAWRPAARSRRSWTPLGVEMLPPEAGIAWIRRELTSGHAGGEVVVAGALGAFVRAAESPAGGLDVSTVSTQSAGPMVGEVVAASVLDGLVVRTTLDPMEQPFLYDHRGDRVTSLLPASWGSRPWSRSHACWRPTGRWQRSRMWTCSPR